MGRSRLNLDGVNVPEDSGELDPREHQVGEEMKMREAHRPVAGRARSGVAAGNAHRPVQPPAPPHRAAQATAGPAGALVPVAAASRRAATGGEEEGGDEAGGAGRAAGRRPGRGGGGSREWKREATTRCSRRRQRGGGIFFKRWRCRGGERIRMGRYGCDGSIGTNGWDGCTVGGIAVA